MKKRAVFIFAVCFGLGGLWADMMRNPPCKSDEGQNSASTCDKCPTDGAENGCVHIQINLGRTSVLSDRRTCQLKVFETEASGLSGDLYAGDAELRDGVHLLPCRQRQNQQERAAGGGFLQHLGGAPAFPL